MKDGIKLGLCIIVCFFFGAWFIPKVIDIIITLYKTSSLFDLFIFVALMFGIVCLGGGE